MHVNIGETVRIEAIVVDYNEREGIAKLRIEGLEDDNITKTERYVRREYKDIWKSSCYKEFDENCRQLGLPEVYKTKSKSQYERFLKMLQEKGILCRGYMNDYNCIFEIRFL